MYPDEKVASFITQNFVPVRIHIKEQPQNFERFGAQWTPTIQARDQDGNERHKIEGFLPKGEFLAQLRLGLHDVRLRRDARVVAVLRELVRALEVLHRVLEELARHIGHAQLEVIRRELRLQQQAQRLEVRGARLDARARRLDAAADASPEIDLPARVERDAVIGRRSALAAPGPMMQCGPDFRKKYGWVVALSTPLPSADISAA